MNPFGPFIAAARVAWAKLFGYKVFADIDTFDSRMSECLVCPFKRKNKCSVCGCYLDAKLVFLTEQCPKRRWLRIWRKKPLTHS
jgi:hypothetical protein